MNLHSYYPNRTKRLNVTPNTTSPRCVGADGNLYATYALLEAVTVPWPGPPSEFPCGIPFVAMRSVATGGATDGSPFFFLTNSKLTPPNYDDMISGSGQHVVLDNDAVRILWIATTVSGDSIIIDGMS